MTKKDRLIALLMALTVIFALLFSACFVIAEADHDCIREDCPVCCQLSICESMLKSVGQTAVPLILAACIGFFTLSLPCPAKKVADHTSLVTLKVKLSD